MGENIKNSPVIFFIKFKTNSLFNHIYYHITKLINYTKLSASYITY